MLGHAQPSNRCRSIATHAGSQSLKVDTKDMASKGGKGKEKEKQVKSPPQVEQERPPEREIIPGKITENQW